MRIGGRGAERGQGVGDRVTKLEDRGSVLRLFFFFFLNLCVLAQRSADLRGMLDNLLRVRVVQHQISGLAECPAWLLEIGGLGCWSLEQDHL